MAEKHLLLKFKQTDLGTWFAKACGVANWPAIAEASWLYGQARKHLCLATGALVHQPGSDKYEFY